MLVGSEGPCVVIDFFFHDAAPTEIYTLSLHDALPISGRRQAGPRDLPPRRFRRCLASLGLPHPVDAHDGDRKSTRLNSSHVETSYAVFCLKKKSKYSNSATGNMAQISNSITSTRFPAK